MNRIILTALASLALLGASFGCEAYVELHNVADRIWIMNKDGTSVLRCIDATPDDKPFRGNAKVFCKAAYMYGTATAVTSEAEATSETASTTKPDPTKRVKKGSSGTCSADGEECHAASDCCGSMKCANGWCAAK